MIAVTTTNFVELYSALSAEHQEYFVKTLNDLPFFSGFFGANAMVGTQAKQPVPVAVKTPNKAKSPQSKGKENVCPPSRADSCAELDTPPREDVNDEPSSEKQDRAMVGKTSLIDALLLPKNVKQKKGEVAKSTQLLHQAGIKRSFAGSHLQQVKHAMREGSIKLVESQTTFGMDNELEGKKLDPHDHIKREIVPFCRWETQTKHHARSWLSESRSHDSRPNS